MQKSELFWNCMDRTLKSTQVRLRIGCQRQVSKNTELCFKSNLLYNNLLWNILFLNLFPYTSEIVQVID